VTRDFLVLCASQDCTRPRPCGVNLCVLNAFFPRPVLVLVLESHLVTSLGPVRRNRYDRCRSALKSRTDSHEARASSHPKPPDRGSKSARIGRVLTVAVMTCEVGAGRQAGRQAGRAEQRPCHQKPPLDLLFLGVVGGWMDRAPPVYGGRDIGQLFGDVRSSLRLGRVFGTRTP
jgi:hypothetical protein